MIVLSALWSGIRGGWRWLWAALLCASPLTALVVLGWALRHGRRAARKSWWRSAGRPLPFREWVPEQAHPPTLVLGQDPVGRLRGRGSPWGLPLGGLGANLKLGLQAAANTWALTLPLGLVWVFAWRLGWEASFGKAVEEAGFGPLAAVLAMLAFAGLMLLVPMAQARHAVTGRWRAFWDLGLAWRLVRIGWGWSVLLALGYAVVGFLVMLMWSGPAFLAQQPWVATATDATILQFLRRYYFGWSLVLLPAFLGLRIGACKAYAHALRRGLQLGEVATDELSEEERTDLAALGLLPVPAPREQALPVRAAVGLGRSGLRLASLSAAALLYLGLSSQVFVANFFHYRPVVGFTNLPLVHLPWFRAIPAHLQEDP